MPAKYIDANTIYHLNPSGRFVIGGPHGDAGLTGRKIIIDSYGGWGAHGGGAFSGKDPTKVDRSAAYAARWIAKSLVAAKLARRCLVQVSYAIGVAHPLSIFVDSYGTGTKSDAELLAIVKANFDLRPGCIIRDLKLTRPIYQVRNLDTKPRVCIWSCSYWYSRMLFPCCFIRFCRRPPLTATLVARTRTSLGRLSSS